MKPEPTGPAQRLKQCPDPEDDKAHGKEVRDQRQRDFRHSKDEQRVHEKDRYEADVLDAVENGDEPRWNLVNGVDDVGRFSFGCSCLHAKLSSRYPCG